MAQSTKHYLYLLKRDKKGAILLTIQQGNTFTGISNTVQPTTITFATTYTQTLTNWNVSGKLTHRTAGGVDREDADAELPAALTDEVDLPAVMREDGIGGLKRLLNGGDLRDGRFAPVARNGKAHHAGDEQHDGGTCGEDETDHQWSSLVSSCCSEYIPSCAMAEAAHDAMVSIAWYQSSASKSMGRLLILTGKNPYTASGDHFVRKYRYCISESISVQ